MNLVDLLKKNIVMVPVVASLVVGTFTGVRYIVNLTDSINTSEQQIINLERDLKQAQKNINRNKYKIIFC
jgi:peptidoglycan hydrolase CwlO-like protein